MRKAPTRNIESRLIRMATRAVGNLCGEVSRRPDCAGELVCDDTAVVDELWMRDVIVCTMV